MMLPLIVDIAPPPASVVGAGLTILQVVACATSYKNERTNPGEYSKFASMKEGKMKQSIPSKTGMLIIYAPATFVAGLFAFVDGLPSSAAAPLLFIHFLKRTLEVLGLHKYSGQVESKAAYAIGTLYALYATVVSSYAVPLGTNDPVWSAVGYALFCVGILGNVYHHYLLTLLRKDVLETGKNRYTPPVGGLFCLVASPHYFFELVLWLGIACVAQQTNAFLAFMTMCSYLSARSENTNEYYFSKFGEEEWPRSMRPLVPFLY
jgi:hypothetical protein